MPLTARVWHVFGGRDGPNFADVLIRNQVALVGPVGPGRWTPDRGPMEYDGFTVQRFATEMRVGDIVLLRTGSATVYTLGIVAGDYEYFPQFEDLHGYGLPHGRRVRWHASLRPFTFEPEPFTGGTSWFGAVGNPVVLEYAERVLHSQPFGWKSAKVADLPPDEPDLVEWPPALAELISLAIDVGPLYWDKIRFGEPPSEHEIVAHFVVPLLRALHWPVEQIALEWHRTDVALFRRLPRTAENLYLVIEAKRLGVNVESKVEQAFGYLQTIGVERDIVVTDGLRFRLYAAGANYATIAYANLARPKQSSLAFFDRLKCPKEG